LSGEEWTRFNLHEPLRRLVDLPKIIKVTVAISDKFFRIYVH